jgi:hypothetical protein
MLAHDSGKGAITLLFWGWLLVATAAPTATSAATVAGAPMRYVYHPPESADDTRYLYQWKILETALEKTRQEFGPYVMERSESMTEKRQANEMLTGSGKLTVMYISTTPEFERALLPVRIPVDRNLGGYSVFLIRRQDQARFSPEMGLGDIRKFSFGLGLGWIDVEILRTNGFRVITGSSYEGLFTMLENGRFDVFLRSATEVLEEYAARRARLPDLAIEENLVLYYPLPMYFWFSRSEEGRHLAERVERGMRQMIADGTYDRIFDQYQGRKIEQLRLNRRTILRIDNPNVGTETPAGDSTLWFDPATYRAPPPLRP